MKLTSVLAEKFKVKNVNSQKYPSHKNQDTQKKYFSASNSASSIDRSK